MMKLSMNSVAGCIARVLKARGIERVFALCGGHIMPIWMRLDAEGIRIIDVRDERAAVHMAQAQTDRHTWGRAGDRRTGGDECHDRHRQCAHLARARSALIWSIAAATGEPRGATGPRSRAFAA